MDLRKLSKHVIKYLKPLNHRIIPWETSGSGQLQLGLGWRKMIPDINGVSSALVLCVLPDFSPLNYILCFYRW